MQVPGIVPVAGGIVVSHLVSNLRFGDLDVSYDDRVLRPRVWTLAQSEWAADLLRDAPSGPVLELFAGVGHIGLAAVAGSDRRLVMVDLNPAACDLARHNVGVAEMTSRVEVREGRIDEVLDADETFSVIIADPPWVPSSGIGRFPDDPAIAIDGGEDGLALARVCCGVIDQHLDADGSAILQLGTTEQADQLDAHLEHVLGSPLRVAQTRAYDRGVLVRLSRPHPGTSVW